MSLFQGKDLSVTIRGNCTTEGNQEFEASRKVLGLMTKRPAHAVSDGDTIEYLSRGHEASLVYFKLHPPVPYVPTKDGKHICGRCKKRPKKVGMSRCGQCLAYAARMQQKYDKERGAKR